MSETKAGYGVAQHIEDADKRQQQEWADFRAAEQAARQARLGGNTILGPGETVEMIQATGLPTLLAQLVNEYREALGVERGEPSQSVESFNTILLAAAQPLLTEYLQYLTNPPQFVVKTKGEDDELSALTKEWARVRSGKL